MLEMSENVKKVITEDIKNKLMAIGGFDIDENIDIVPDDFKELPKEFWPKFTFKNLNSIETLRFQTMVSKLDSKDSDVIIQVYEQIIGFLDSVFLGVSNMRDLKDPEKVLDLEGVNIIKHLPISLITSLSVQLVTKNKLTEEELEGLT
jgi:hypothetical protein